MENWTIAMLLVILAIDVYLVLVGVGFAGRQSRPNYEVWYSQNGSAVKWGGIFIILAALLLIMISVVQ